MTEKSHSRNYTVEMETRVRTAYGQNKHVYINDKFKGKNKTLHRCTFYVLCAFNLLYCMYWCLPKKKINGQPIEGYGFQYRGKVWRILRGICLSNKNNKINIAHRFTRCVRLNTTC